MEIEEILALLEVQLHEAMQDISKAKTADQLFTAQGVVKALINLQGEFQVRASELEEARKSREEGLTSAHA